MKIQMSNDCSMPTGKTQGKQVKSGEAGRCVNTPRPLPYPSASTEQEGY